MLYEITYYKPWGHGENGVEDPTFKNLIGDTLKKKDEKNNKNGSTALYMFLGQIYINMS